VRQPFVVLLRRYGGTGAELDAIRTASAITVAAGGAAALLLAARRQQSTEQTLEHERENAAEQRITELYTRAVDQLGAEKAPGPARGAGLLDPALLASASGSAGGRGATRRAAHGHTGGPEKAVQATNGGA